MIHHNDHFIFKIHAPFFMGSGFLVSHRRIHRPRHFYGLSPLGTMSDHNWRVFHPTGDLSLLADNCHIFSLSFQSTAQVCWTLSYLPSSTNQTSNTVSIYQPCTHTQPNAMPPCIYNAKFHYILAHVTCIIHYIEQFINRNLCQVPWIIISKAYNLHPFMLIYVTPIYQHIYNTFSMLLNFQQ